MDPQLDATFISGLSVEPFQFIFRDRAFTLVPSTARAGLIAAEAEVVENGEVVGYLTAYSKAEVGACRASMFGAMAPIIFRHLSNAMTEILGPAPQTK